MKIPSPLKSAARKILANCGYELRRSTPRRLAALTGRKIPDASRLYVGCGEDTKPGFIGCDIRPLSTVQLVCAGWEVSRFTQTAKEIFSRHMLEHLTDAEARATLADWYEALGVGGTVHIIVPDIDFHIKQWLSSDWREPRETNPKSNACWSFAGFYGWQRECDPTKPNYNQSYWDVHKSAYNASRLQSLLEETGFAKVEMSTVDSCHLVAIAVKLTQKKERQVSPKVEGIRLDHVARYKFALEYVPVGGCVADAACGVGYGSYIIASNNRANSIHGFDIDGGAIEYARLHYNHKNIIYHQVDLARSPFSENAFNLMISFETIEHLKNAEAFLNSVFGALVSGGIFICSTPNEETFPLLKMGNKYHYRHYTPSEFEDILKKSGFTIEDRFTQTDSLSEHIQRGWHGLYNIAICRKT